MTLVSCVAALYRILFVLAVDFDYRDSTSVILSVNFYAVRLSEDDEADSSLFKILFLSLNLLKRVVL